MSQSNSGEQDLALAKVDEYLDGYCEKIGLKSFTESDISFYMELNQEGLRKLSPEECYEGAYILKKEALYVQSQANKIAAQLKWAQGRVSAIISPELQSYGGRNISFETQRNLAIRNNDVARNIHNNIIKKCELTLERLSYIPKQLGDLADVLLKYATMKIGEVRNASKNN